MDADHFDRLSRTLARRLSRRAALTGSAIGTLVVAASPGLAAQPVTPEATPVAEPVAFLLVQVAESGRFHPTGEPDVYELELDHASGMTLAFADRPAREVRLLPTAEALSVIGFTPDPPNAALVTGPADGEFVVVVELLDGSYEALAGSLTYRVQVLAETDRLTLTAAIEGRAVVVAPASFGHASLFIDDVAVIPYATTPGSCGSTICDADQTCCNGTCVYGSCVSPPTPDPTEMIECGSATCQFFQCCNQKCCDADQTCCNGTCCDAGLTCCRGQCIDGACT
ncbi:MAG: hypothetical protein AB7V46_05390 [Thermomicrobiales bacterium]